MSSLKRQQTNKERERMNQVYRILLYISGACLVVLAGVLVSGYGSPMLGPLTIGMFVALALGVRVPGRDRCRGGADRVLPGRGGLQCDGLYCRGRPGPFDHPDGGGDADLPVYDADADAIAGRAVCADRHAGDDAEYFKYDHRPDCAGTDVQSLLARLVSVSVHYYARLVAERHRSDKRGNRRCW